MKWEYMTFTETTNRVTEINMTEFLNKFGDDGWELVSIIPGYFIKEPWVICKYHFTFKRTKQTNKK